MKTFVSPGDSMTLPAPYDVVSGSPVQFGAALFGVAIYSALSGADVSFKTSGVFEGLPKATGAAWTVGDIIYWDNTNKVLTKTNTGNLRVGVAVAAALSGDAVGSIKLCTAVIA